MLREKVPALCGRHNYCQSYYLDTVIEVSKAVGKEIQLEDILKVIIEKTAEVMEAERCTVFIYDEPTNELWSYVAMGIEVNEIRFPLSVGIAGHVAGTRIMANIPKAYDDPRFNCEFDVKTGYQTRSILCYPMLNHEDRLVGVLQVINKKNAGAFDRDDEILMEGLSGHATAAIERAFLTRAYMEHKKNQDIMNMAREIQMSMLPKKFPTHTGDSNIDLYAFISPAKEVGGDFYDFFFIDEHLLCFAIGDVSDKGVPAALFMAVVKTLFRTLAKKDTSPRQVLDNINKELCRDNEMMMFVTMFIGILDTASGRFTYGNGGHNPPYIMFENGRIKQLEANLGPAPGLIGEANYEEATLMLNDGSTIFLYTDGVDEAKNKEGKMFSISRLEELLCNISCSSLKEMTAKVVSAVTDFSAGASQSDDITLLSVKYFDMI